MAQSRQLAAIMFTDIVGYTALMGEDEQKAYQLLSKNRELQRPIINQFGGRWIKEMGDGIIASFKTVSDAVNAAVRIQGACNSTKDYLLRIGIHQGEVIFEDEDVFGDGVNIASRIQSSAKPGSIYVSESVHQNVSNKKEFISRFVKEELLKNVRDPVRIYEINTIDNSAELTESQLMNVPLDSIAVLPFTNMSSDPEQEYFSEGITEEIINTLAQVPKLRVTGRTSSFQFKGAKVDLREVGEKLSVRTVLEGSVRSSGNRIRITAQLIDVNSGFHLWSEKYDRVLNDVFEVQDEIAKAIADKLQSTLSGKSIEPKSREQTQNVEAYQCYLKGRALIYKGGRYILEAVPLFEKALEIDREYALAHAGLADAYFGLCLVGYMEPKVAWPKVIESATQAMKFGPNLAESLTCNGAIAFFYENDLEKAECLFLKAIEHNPGYEQAIQRYAQYLLSLAFGKHNEAIDLMRSSIKTNPLSASLHTIAGYVFLYAGKYEEAAEKAERGAGLDPNSFYSQITLPTIYIYSGNYKIAEEILETILTKTNRHTLILMLLAALYWQWGKKEMVTSYYEELLALSDKKYVQTGLLYFAAGFMEKYAESLKFAHQACEEHDPFFIMYARDGWAIARHFHSVPGYDEILKRINQINRISYKE
jgi:adenylate cyclase